MRYGAIDLGSHTARFIVGEERGGFLVPLDHGREFTKVALESKDFTISPSSIEKITKILKGYIAHFKELGVGRYFCGATGIFRKAKNKDEICKDLKELHDINCFVISEEEEALLAIKGALWVLKAYREVEEPIVFFDLGGSSTEIVFVENGEIKWWKSFFIGSAGLTKEYLTSAPTNLDEALSYAKKVLEDIGKLPKPRSIIGSGGTSATLGALKIGMEKYVPYKVCTVDISIGWLEETINLLSSLSLEERRALKGMEKGREDVILGGSIIVFAILKILRAENLMVSDAGLLEGLLIKAAGKDLEFSLPL